MGVPKIIHYCWFGGNSLPPLAQKCISSWKKFCPDYEIMEWNEQNFDLRQAPLYVRQAYEAKKWAFVTDYVRLYAMLQHGGIYMDTDVEVVKPLDEFLQYDAFSGFEDGIHVSTGVMACSQNHPMFQKMLGYYDSASFYNPDGSMNLTTNVETVTKLWLEHGLRQDNSFQVLDGIAIYPKDVFSPISYQTGKLERTKNTHTIHWFSGSWHTEEQKEEKKKYDAYLRREQRKYRLSRLPNKIGTAVFGEERYVKIRRFLKGHD